MNLDTVDNVYDVLESLDDTSEANKNLAYKCVQRAQTLADPDLEMEARKVHFRQVIFLGYQEQALPLYPWFLNTYDKDPEKWSWEYEEILWMYKWIIGTFAEYAAISKEKIESFQKDFEQRYRDYGSGERILLRYRMRLSLDLGQPEQAWEYYQRSLQIKKRGSLDDCEACMLNNAFDTLSERDQFEAILETGKPIIERKMTCHIIPERAWPDFITAAMMLDRWEEAARYFQSGYRALDRNHALQSSFSHLLIYCGVIGHDVKGRKIMSSQLSLTTPQSSDKEQLELFTACHLFCHSLASRGKKSIKLDLDLPKGMEHVLPQPQKASSYKPEELSQSFRSLALKHALALDKRNGNSFFQDRFAHKCEQIEKQRLKLEKNTA